MVEVAASVVEAEWLARPVAQWQEAGRIRILAIRFPAAGVSLLRAGAPRGEGLVDLATYTRATQELTAWATGPDGHRCAKAVGKVFREHKALARGETFGPFLPPPSLGSEEMALFAPMDAERSLIAHIEALALAFPHSATTALPMLTGNVSELPQREAAICDALCDLGDGTEDTRRARAEAFLASVERAGDAAQRIPDRLKRLLGYSLSLADPVSGEVRQAHVARAAIVRRLGLPCFRKAVLTWLGWRKRSAEGPGGGFEGTGRHPLDGEPIDWRGELDRYLAALEARYPVVGQSLIG